MSPHLFLPPAPQEGSPPPSWWGAGAPLLGWHPVHLPVMSLVLHPWGTLARRGLYSRARGSQKLPSMPAAPSSPMVKTGSKPGRRERSPTVEVSPPHSTSALQRASAQEKSLSPRGSEGKESACNAGDPGLIPWSGRSPGEGNSHPLQDSCLGNPMDRGAWRATVREFAKSRTPVSNGHFHCEACGNSREDSTRDHCNRGGQVPPPA